MTEQMAGGMTVAVRLLGESTHFPVKLVMAQDRNSARAQRVPQAVDRFHQAPGKASVC